MKKTKLPIVLLSVAAIGFACGEKKADPEKPTAAVVSNVQTAKITRSSISDYYEASGTVAAKTTTQVSANIMGRIVSIPVNEGDAVSKGQVLVQIDDRDAATQLAKAQAGLKEAESAIVELENSVAAASAAVKTAEANKQFAEITFARYKELYVRKSVSGQEFDDAHSKLKVATSEFERAQANVRTLLSKKAQINARIDQAKADIANSRIYSDYAKIVSPVSGVVVRKLAEQGAVASPGVPLLSIEDNSRYRLEVAVEESRSRLVHVGNRVNIRVDALGAGETYGTVAEVLPAADPSSRSYTVKIDLPSDQSLRSGLYGVARFPVSQKEAVTVPEQALFTRGQLTGVYVVGPDGIARFRIVTVGKRAEGQAEILSGLSEGDEIVSTGVERVNDGAKVK